MKTSRLILINVVLLLIIVGASLGGYYYYYQQTHFVKTDDAQVQGGLMTLSASTPGQLVRWKGKEGSTFQKGDVIGQVKGADGQTSDIKAPKDGTIVQNQGKKGQMITPGQPLGSLVDMDELYIVANIEETEIQDVKEGAEVDISIDAQSDTTIKGQVEQTGLATVSTFSLMPQQNASGDYTKVVQRIPVHISMDEYPEGLVPGMNATVSIDR
ncbi:HlyD family efflux transporter periplasmic adaptor subunit [Paludifilum halophilum]|uniref:Transporter n=1 Tax=Paludifilum halophilum TaxID=1642702 RepID=A0A235B3C9_9BACL|nr:HlyD family efflux transporter periplasmic adaptor subunit [Paludifilum halophilum]OYD06816.1 transporter [Paludifilum halophilum]